jgi:hypothetical protein
MMLWILGLLGIGVLGFLALVVWGLFNHPDGFSLTAYSERLNGLHCERTVADSVIRALLSMPALPDTHPDVESCSELMLLHFDEHYASIRIRTQEMCAGELSPEFEIETPSYVYASFGEEGPFESKEIELEHYLNGAKAIAEALVDEGLERITNVTIDDKNYSL